ncbi:hypothetical protein HPB50_004749 [Hyalomma asiaticum]|uniref:Uncharacterized protein n=1 Tax=Hyalomma asiaticum TaxID=266040 RepID=A0ACB7TCS9_HYAAI|nr:hypothetical protein HPB50_004749 [Hyalomma asiaticum]
MTLAVGKDWERVDRINNISEPPNKCDAFLFTRSFRMTEPAPVNPDTSQMFVSHVFVSLAFQAPLNDNQRYADYRKVLYLTPGMVRHRMRAGRG